MTATYTYVCYAVDDNFRTCLDILPLPLTIIQNSAATTTTTIIHAEFCEDKFMATKKIVHIKT